MEIGIDITRAKRDVRIVPMKKGRAPNLRFTGSHSLPKKNFKPKILREGIEVINSVKKAAMSKTIVMHAPIRIIILNRRFFTIIFIPSHLFTINDYIGKVKIKQLPHGFKPFHMLKFLI